jgi:hypothetical protein
MIYRTAQIDEYSLVQFEGLDRDDPDSVSIVLAQIDNAIQFGEDQEPSGKVQYGAPRAQLIPHAIFTTYIRNLTKYPCSE